MRLRSGRQNQGAGPTSEPNTLSPESSELPPQANSNSSHLQPAATLAAALVPERQPACRPAPAATKREHTLRPAPAVSEQSGDPACAPAPDEEDTERQHSAASLEALVEAAAGSDPRARLAAVQAIRKLLSSDKNPPIDALVQGGVLPVLVQCLQAEDEWVTPAARTGARDSFGLWFNLGWQRA